MSLRKLLSIAALAGLFLSTRSEAAIFTVTSTNDANDGTCNSAHCSLREAIIAANAAAGADVIEFSVSGTITTTPGLALPSFSDLTIDATTAPGPISLVSGDIAATSGTGLLLQDNSTVRGMNFQDFNYGLLVLGANNQIKGCTIGTDPSGTALGLRNYIGIELSGATNTIIGGPAAEDRNLISGNTYAGIFLSGSTGTVIQGNDIGTDVSGTAPISNLGPGVWLNSGVSNSLIGGTGVGEGNTIAFNQSGLAFYNNPGLGNSILGNSIHSNSSLGISFQFGTPTLNDLLDTDSPATNNGLQNFPVISAVRLEGSCDSLKIDGSLNSKVLAQDYRIEFFLNDALDASLYGEGKYYLGSMPLRITDGSGTASFTDVSFPISTNPAGQFITATATSPDGSTSEFARGFEITSSTVGTVQFTSPTVTVDEGSGTAQVTLERSCGSGEIFVQVSTSDGTAVAGEDYETFSQVVKFEEHDTEKTVSLTLLDDANDEADETLSVQLSNLTGTAVFGATTETILTITDDEAPASPNGGDGTDEPTGESQDAGSGGGCSLIR